MSSEPPPPQPSFLPRLLRSSGAATFSQVWRMGVTLLTHMVLRRLVEEEAFGLFLWADYFFLLLSQLRDLGLPAHVVRDPSRPYGAFLAVELGWGSLFAATVFLFSPWVAVAGGGGATATRLVQLFALFLVLDGLSKVPLTYFEAELAVDRALLPELCRNVTYSLLSIALALAGAGVWSLLIAHVTATAVFAAFLWWRAWGRIPLRRPQWSSIWPLLRTSTPLMAMAFLLVAIERVDYLIVIQRFGAKVNGIYSGGLTLALLLTMAVELPLRRALYPAFVAVRGEAHRFFETYRLSTLLLLSAMVPFALILAVNAELALALWGRTRDYGAAAPYLPLLALAPLAQPFARCAEDVLLSRHEERLLIVASLVTLGSVSLAGILLTTRFGVIGMAWAKLLPVGSLIVTWGVARIDPPAFWKLARDLLFVYLVPLPLFGPLLSVHPPLLRAALSLLAAALVALVYAWRFGEAFRRFLRQGAERPVSSA